MYISRSTLLGVLCWTGGWTSAFLVRPGHQHIPIRSRPALSAAGVSTAESESWFETFKANHKNDGDEPPVMITMPNQQSISQVLAEVFSQVLIAEEEGVPRVLMFPNAERLYDPETMAKFVDHLDLCKDCCEVLGTSQNVVGLGPQVPGSSSAPVPAIYIKPMQTGDYNFEPDPFWDDDEGDSPGFNFEGDDDEIYEDGGSAKLYKVPEDDNQIIGGMKAWVGAVIADLGVCPFTVDADKAGLPVGAIRYEISRESKPEAIYSKYWQEVSLLSGPTVAKEKELSTTLLITPHFGLQNREFFESFSNTLTQPLEPLQLEDDIQLVFFHPTWVFRDGADRMGSDSAANFARRSPWPMINILRTPQVRKAQKAIPTGLVYRQNEVTLDKIGFDKLQGWLEERDWGEVKNNYRVDRRTVPILSTAQDLLQGKVPLTSAEDIKVVDTPQTEAEELGEPASAYEAQEEDDGFPAQEDDDDDWDAPFDSRSMIEVPDDVPRSRPQRSREEVVKDCVEVIRLIRKRVSQEGTPLTPQEVKQFETLVENIV